MYSDHVKGLYLHISDWFTSCGRGKIHECRLGAPKYTIDILDLELPITLCLTLSNLPFVNTCQMNNRQ